MNYTQLVAVSIAYTDRYDLEVANNVDNYILLVEARVNRLLKTRKQSARIYTATQDNLEYYSLPPDWSGMRDIQMNSLSPNVEHSVQPMSYLEPESFNTKRGQPYDGCLYYTVIANQLQVYPIQEAGKTIEMVYYQNVPNLNSIDSTNWMSVDQPDIYVAGMTAEIELFAKNYEAADGWTGRMKLAVDELDSADGIERWSGSMLTTRIG